MRNIKIFVLLSSLYLCSCVSRAPLQLTEKAMRPAEPPVLKDDLSLQQLSKALKANTERLMAKGISETLQFGEKIYAREDYVLALDHFSDFLEKEESLVRVSEYVKENFDFFEIYGQKEWGEVFMTSYYDPVIQGSWKKTKKFSQALYKVPSDMVTIDYSEFLEVFPKLRPSELPHEQKSKGSVLRGRLISNDEGIDKVVPYYSREEIDSEGALKGKKLEMLWVDPIDAFFLQIQGSGIVEVESKDGRKKKVRVGYAAQNGHSYVAIGRHLTDVIPIEKMSLQTIQSYLRTLSPEEIQKVLNLNPSYVFFRPLETKSITYFGTEVVAGRTIATDYRYFPKGALGYLEFEKPQFEDENAEEPISWVPSSRFVIDQDTGGAIRGGHRLDLYWGEGKLARQAAGVMKRWGKLFYLAPKDEFLRKLR